jgi:vitamin B12 transporter
MLAVLLRSSLISFLLVSTVNVSGAVRDTSGAVIAGASVEALVAGRGVAATTTGADGRYALEVPAGVPVEIRVRRDGFADQIVSIPGAGSAVSRDITLHVGGVSDSLVVTASRGLESRATVTESVTAFSHTEIERLGSSSLAEIIKFVPGVNVESAGREGSLTSMFSRGGESDYNLVLIDGVRVNQSGGTFDFGRISASEIDRVEVVRGAQSSLWGSDAMGAVVQIFTRRAGPNDAPRLSGSAEGGSFGTWRTGARVNGGARRRVDYQAGVSHRRTDGAFADLLRDGDAFEQTGADAGAGVTIGRQASIRGAVRYTRAEGKSVGAIAFGARDTGGVYDTKDLSGHFNVSHVLGSRFTGTGAVNMFRYESTSADTVGDPAFGTFAILEGTPNALFPNGTRLVRFIDVTEFNALVAAGATPGPGQFLASRQSSDFPFTSDVEFRRPAFRYQGDLAWGGGQRLSAGYEWERESNPLTAAFKLTNHAGFIQQRFTIGDRWFATVGGRVDSKQNYDTFFSPKLSAGGYLVPFRRGPLSSLKVFGNIGKGIKSPTFAERFGGSFADPSPDLRVERARTGDIGAEATFADQRFRALVTYFNNDYVDQIAFRSGVTGDGIPEFINIDGSKADGWELEWALQRPAAGFTASATYALVDSKVVTNISTNQQFQPGQPLLRRPKHSGALRAAYVRDRLTISASARIVGDRHDNSFLSLRTVPNAARPAAVTTDITVNPGYAVVHAGVDVRAHDIVTLFVRADNAGDTAYESALGYPGMPRSVMAGARFNFGLR